MLTVIFNVAANTWHTVVCWMKEGCH